MREEQEKHVYYMAAPFVDFFYWPPPLIVSDVIVV